MAVKLNPAFVASLKRGAVKFVALVLGLSLFYVVIVYFINLEKRVGTLERTPTVIEKINVVTPTATPTATLRLPVRIQRVTPVPSK